MPGRGTGVPLFFACPNERKQRNYLYATRARVSAPNHEVELTGRRKPYNTSNHSPRSTNIKREYRCLECGHIGWSNHVDLARRDPEWDGDSGG